MSALTRVVRTHRPQAAGTACRTLDSLIDRRRALERDRRDAQRARPVSGRLRAARHAFRRCAAAHAGAGGSNATWLERAAGSASRSGQRDWLAPTSSKAQRVERRPLPRGVCDYSAQCPTGVGPGPATPRWRARVPGLRPSCESRSRGADRARVVRRAAASIPTCALRDGTVEGLARGATVGPWSERGTSTAHGASLSQARAGAAELNRRRRGFKALRACRRPGHVSGASRAHGASPEQGGLPRAWCAQSMLRAACRCESACCEDPRAAPEPACETSRPCLSVIVGLLRLPQDGRTLARVRRCRTSLIGTWVVLERPTRARRTQYALSG